MKYSNLPGTADKAAAIVLGCAWFGTDIDEARAFAIMDEYAAQGGNFLDTAHIYASWVPGGAGKSETTIGKWLKQRNPREMLIGTKGADQGMNDKTIRRQLAESLARLERPYVDFYWLHYDDPQVPVDEIIDSLNGIVADGLIRSFGCSNWRVERIRAAQKYASAHKLRGFAASQISWSLARANPQVIEDGNQVFMDETTNEFHRRSQLPLVAYSSQAGGFFAGKYDPVGAPPGQSPNPAIVKYYGTPGNYRRLAAAKELACKYGVSPNQIALAYLLNESFPAFAIVGAGKVEYVRDSCGAADLRLTADEMAHFDALNKEEA